MNRKVVALVLVIALVIAAALVVYAQGGRRAGQPAQPGMGRMAGSGGPGGLGCGMGFGRVLAELNLTAEQTKELQAVKDNFIAATKDTRTEIQAKAKEMMALWAVDQPNGDAIKALAAQIDGLRAIIREAGIDHALQGLSVLTPQQREKLRTLMKDRPGCGLMLGCALGMGMGPGAGCGMGPGAGMGPGCGMGGAFGKHDGTGPRTGTPACPMTR